MFAIEDAETVTSCLDFVMNDQSAQPRDLHILFVDCAQHNTCSDVLTGISYMEFAVAATPSIAQEMMKLRKFDCVLIRVDPGSRESLAQLDAVRPMAIDEAIPLNSMSTFNASWIENLMAQQGVKKHFRRFPNHGEILNTMIGATKPAGEQVEGAGP